VVFQNVFFSLFDGQKVSWTSLMEIALDGLISVQFPNVSAQVIYRLFAVNALCFPLVNLYDVFLFFFLCLEIKSTSVIELALNFFSLVLIFYVIVQSVNWSEKFAFRAVNAFEFSVEDCVMLIFIFLVRERNLTLKAIEYIQDGNFHWAGLNQFIWNQDF